MVSRLIHELTGFLVALAPVFLAHDLGLELRALAHGTLAGVVADRLVHGHRGGSWKNRREQRLRYRKSSKKRAEERIEERASRRNVLSVMLGPLPRASPHGRRGVHFVATASGGCLSRFGVNVIPSDGRHRTPLVRIFSVASETPPTPVTVRLQVGGSRGGHSRDASWNIAAFGLS